MSTATHLITPEPMARIAVFEPDTHYHYVVASDNALLFVKLISTFFLPKES